MHLWWTPKMFQNFFLRGTRKVLKHFCSQHKCFFYPPGVYSCRVMLDLFISSLREVNVYLWREGGRDGRDGTQITLFDFAKILVCGVKLAADSKNNIKKGTRRFSQKLWPFEVTVHPWLNYSLPGVQPPGHLFSS